MAREYKRSTRLSTYNNYDADVLDKIIVAIKKTGNIPSGKFISPNQIEPYLKLLYREVIKCRDNKESTKMDLDRCTMEFINLSQPIQLSLVKRFWVGESFDELQSLVVLKIMEIIKYNTYDETKASLTSQIYENVYQVLLKNFKDEKEHEKRHVNLIDFDFKMQPME